MKETTTPTTTATQAIEPEAPAKPFELGPELNKFETDVAMALNNGDEWVETHPEIIAYFNKRSKEPVDYFIYKAIKVAPHGKSAEIDDRLNRPMSEILHGRSEGKVVGRSER